ncbi:MAG: hypothetical protein K8R79_07535, partial [Calditrichales bacterium]|nr:hypothetical protein [Calditrichales bacterium]
CHFEDLLTIPNRRDIVIIDVIRFLPDYSGFEMTFWVFCNSLLIGIAPQASPWENDKNMYFRSDTNQNNLQIMKSA